MSSKYESKVFPALNSCKFKGNNWIDCDRQKDKNCEHCGWNPEVVEKRKKANSIRYGVKRISEAIEELHDKFTRGLITRQEAYEEMDHYKRIIFRDYN